MSSRRPQRHRPGAPRPQTVPPAPATRRAPVLEAAPAAVAARQVAPTSPLPTIDGSAMTLNAMADIIERQGGDVRIVVGNSPQVGILDHLVGAGFARAGLLLLESLVRHAPDDTDRLELLRRRAIVAHAQGDRALMLACAEEIRSGRFGQMERAQLDLASMFLQIGEYHEGLQAATAALRINPRSVTAAVGVANAYACLTQYDEALHYYARASQGEPRVPAELMARVPAQLVLGHLSRALTDNEARIGWQQQRPGVHRAFYPPHWSGAPLRGRTLLVWGESGNGDMLQYSRFVPQLRQFGGRVVFAVPPYLVSLFRAANLADEVVSYLDEPPPHDEQVLLESVPRILGVELDTIPSAEGYLVAPDADGEPASAGPVRRAGIVWAGSPNHGRDYARSMPIDALRHLIALTPGIEWTSLQVGPRAGEPTRDPALAAIRQPGEPLTDYAATARVIAGLDLVVGVDTSVVHLAGALGKPVWTLLSTGPADARWMFHRDDTPWYRSMRLIRQRRPDDWHELVERVAGELQSATRPTVVLRSA